MSKPSRGVSKPRRVRAQALRRDDPVRRSSPVDSQQELDRQIAETARRLQDLFKRRYTTNYTDKIWLDGFFVGADYADQSSGRLLRYRDGGGR